MDPELIAAIQQALAGDKARADRLERQQGNLERLHGFGNDVSGDLMRVAKERAQMMQPLDERSHYDRIVNSPRRKATGDPVYDAGAEIWVDLFLDQNQNEVDPEAMFERPDGQMVNMFGVADDHQTAFGTNRRAAALERAKYKIMQMLGGGQ